MTDGDAATDGAVVDVVDGAVVVVLVVVDDDVSEGVVVVVGSPTAATGSAVTSATTPIKPATVSSLEGTPALPRIGPPEGRGVRSPYRSTENDACIVPISAAPHRSSTRIRR
jgi:hypothetical protein